MTGTALAAIIIGCGATMAAMVMPFKFPGAPIWAVRMNWWGGWLSIIAGVVYLLSSWLS